MKRLTKHGYTLLIFGILILLIVLFIGNTPIGFLNITSKGFNVKTLTNYNKYYDKTIKKENIKLNKSISINTKDYNINIIKTDKESYIEYDEFHKDKKLFKTVLVDNINNITKITNSNNISFVNFKPLFTKKSNLPNITIGINDKEIINNLNIESDTTNLTINNITINNIFLEINIGEIMIDNLTVIEKGKIDIDIGKLEIINSNSNNLILKSDISKIKYSGKLTGNSNISSNIGDIDIYLKNKDVNIDASVSIGELYINGNKQSGFDKSYKNNNFKYKNNLKSDNDIGNISIKLKE